MRFKYKSSNDDLLTMKIEICSFSVESCLNAERAGASRIELCGGLYEGGTTPSYGLVLQARQNVRIPIHVMIRPRGGDFCYSKSELDVMRQDLQALKNTGIEGVVFGFLKSNGEIDLALTEEFIAMARPFKVTFHRAFDITPSPLEALEKLIELGVDCVLTSGQQPTAEEGITLLTELVSHAQNRIEIMAGSGINATNAALIAQTGVHALHLTAKATRKSTMKLCNPPLKMASALPQEENIIIFSNEGIIKEVWKAVNQQNINF
ncbi:MAG: copper homeostasis protein CutC [Runella sp.]